MPGTSQTPRPPTARVRRDLLREIEELKRKLAAAEAAAKAREKPKRSERPVEAAKAIEDAAALLPKDSVGFIDWSRALADGAIAPRPSADPSGPAQAVLDLDVELANSGPLFRAVFSHAPHTAWLSCSSCHPAIFPLKRRAPTVVSMTRIREGQYCGACHGPVAFGVEDRCARCHPAIPARAEWRAPEPRKPIERARTFDEVTKLLPSADGGPDWAKALRDEVIAPRPGIDPKAKDEDVLDLELVRREAEPFKVVFPHAAHTAWLGCDSCHPAPFEMQAGATPMPMDKILAGQLCGVCHGPVAFGVEGRCARCHPAIPAKAEWRAPEPRKPIERARTFDEVAKLLPSADGGPDWAKALRDEVIAPRPGIDPKAKDEDVLDLDLVRHEAEPFKVVFPHAAHTAWLGCDSCHPAPFEMQAGATSMPMDKIFEGQYCGVCHGRVAFAVDACGRCHPAMGG